MTQPSGPESTVLVSWKLLAENGTPPSMQRPFYLRPFSSFNKDLIAFDLEAAGAKLLN